MFISLTIIILSLGGNTFPSQILALAEGPGVCFCRVQHWSAKRRTIIVKILCDARVLSGVAFLKLITIIFHISAGIDTSAKTAHPSDYF